MFNYPHSTKVFSYFKWNFLYFNLCLLPFLLSLNTTEKSLAPSSLLPEQVFIHMDKIPPIHFCFWLNSLSSLSLSLYDGCSNPLIIFIALQWTFSSMPMSLLYWGAQDWTQYSRCGLTSAEQKGRILQ